MTINNSEAEILDTEDEQAQDLNQGLGPAEQVEAAIRDFVRQDVTHVRRVPAHDQPTEVVASVNSLVQRVAGASLREMQNVIWELESLRDFLQSEGERVQREISNYAQLAQAAMTSTRSIADNMVHWKKFADGKRSH
jgi:hypothetical protein